MVCIKCGKPLEQTRCDGCGYTHEETIRLLERPEETELILSWDDFSVPQLQAMIRQKEAALQQLRRVLQAKGGATRGRKPQTGSAPSGRRPRGIAEREQKPQLESMEDYLRKLTELYLENGKNMPSDQQISAFLEENRLTERFGIQPQWVRMDLLRIQKENAGG